MNFSQILTKLNFFLNYFSIESMWCAFFDIFPLTSVKVANYFYLGIARRFIIEPNMLLWKQVQRIHYWTQIS